MSNNSNDKPSSKLNDSITTMAAEIKKEFKIGEGGVVEVPKDFYEKTLPAGMTMADVRKVQDHDANLIAATGLALGEVGIDHFKRHKKADQLSVDFVAGKNKVGLVFQRSKKVQDGKGGTLEKHGALSARYVVSGAGNRGNFKKVRDHLAGMAADVLAS